MNTLLRISDLRTYCFTSEGIVHAVDGINLYVNDGEAVGIVGESGCGKSMTARSILRLVPSPPGRIVGGKIWLRSQNLLELDEKEIRRIRGGRISMVFQDPMTFVNPIMTIGNQIKETIELHQHLRGIELNNKVVEALRRARIPSAEEITHYYAHQLSGGMRQRALIAMAISCSPELLIADEPTTALDVTIQAQIMQLLKDLITEMKLSLLFISHDLGLVADICNRVYVMYAGQIIEHASTDELFTHPRHPYTQGLLSSVAHINKKVDEFPTIKGSVPNLLSPPTGCRFNPRCPHVMQICLRDDPAVGDIEEKGGVACWLHMAPKES